MMKVKVRIFADISASPAREIILLDTIVEIPEHYEKELRKDYEDDCKGGPFETFEEFVQRVFDEGELSIRCIV